MTPGAHLKGNFVSILMLLLLNCQFLVAFVTDAVRVLLCQLLGFQLLPDVFLWMLLILQSPLSFRLFPVLYLSSKSMKKIPKILYSAEDYITANKFQLHSWFQKHCPSFSLNFQEHFDLKRNFLLTVKLSIFS